jgi:surface protein
MVRPFSGKQQFIGITGVGSMIEEEEQVATPHSVSIGQQSQTTTTSLNQTGGFRASYKALLSARGWTSTNTVSKGSHYFISDNEHPLTGPEDIEARYHHKLESSVDSPSKRWAFGKLSISNTDGAAGDKSKQDKGTIAIDKTSNHSLERRLNLPKPKTHVRSVTGDGEGFSAMTKDLPRTKLEDDDDTDVVTTASEDEIIKRKEDIDGDEDELGESLHQYSMQDLEMASSFPDPQQYPEMSLGTESETSTSEDEREQVVTVEMFSPNVETKLQRQTIDSRVDHWTGDKTIGNQNNRDKVSWKSQRMNKPTSLLYNDRTGFLDDGDGDDDDGDDSRIEPKLQLLETSILSSQSLVGPGRTFEEIYKQLENEEEEKQLSWKPRPDDDSLSQTPLRLYQSSLSTSYDEEDACGATTCVLPSNITGACLQPKEHSSTESTQPDSQSKSLSTNIEDFESSTTKQISVIDGDNSDKQNSVPEKDILRDAGCQIQTSNIKTSDKTMHIMDSNFNSNPKENTQNRISDNHDDPRDARQMSSQHDDPSSILRYLSSGQSEEGPDFWMEDDGTAAGSSPRSPSRPVPNIELLTNNRVKTGNGYIQSQPSPNPIMQIASTGTTPRVRNIFKFSYHTLESDRNPPGIDDEVPTSPLSLSQYVQASTSDNTKKKVNRSPLSRILSGQATGRQFKRQNGSTIYPVERLQSDDLHDIYDDLESSDPRYIETKSVEDTISMVTYENHFSVDGKPSHGSKAATGLPYEKSEFVRRNNSSHKRNKASTREEEKHSVFVRVVLPCLILLFVVAVVVGGVCGTGQCVRSRNNGASADDTPKLPWIGNSQSSQSAYAAFRTTEEFYLAIDSYLSMYDNDSSPPPKQRRTLVKQKYGERIGDWDVSLLTDFAQAFDKERDPPLDARSLFNEDISRWNVSGALSMRGMFRNTITFDQNIGGWNVSKVNDMSYMFQNAMSFNKPLASWDVTNVRDMSYMFKEAVEFNSDISMWNVGNVQDMYSMFARASTFNSNISLWNVSSVTDMAFMFNRASSFSGDISKWKVSNVATMQVMFQRADMFNSDLSDWDVSNTVDMKYMFYGAASFNSDLTKWNVSKVTNMFSMFNQATNFDGDVSKWDVSNVVDMDSMFQLATSFQGDLSSWNVSKCVNMAYMFFGAKKFNSDVSNWDVSSVETMHRMFRHATAFDQDVSKWQTTNLIDAAYMFANATSFKQNLCEWGSIFANKTNSNPTQVDTTDMFLYSSCPFELAPNASKGFAIGPWCYSQD